MNKEIEEILNDLQRVADRKCYPEDILDGSIAQEWVDYITNLQEEYDNEAEENLKLSEWLVKKQQRIEGLEAENETLRNDFKNQVEYTNKIADEKEKLKEKLYKMTTKFN